MRRIPFERPTEHYDERVMPIDEQLSALLKQRKELSDNNPGFPPFERIAAWAEKYELYEDFLMAVFGTLMSEERFKPVVQPENFRKHIPVMLSFEDGEFFYTLNSIRQYGNASVATFNMDWDATTEAPSHTHNRHDHFELFIGESYDSRMTTGGSTSGHSSYNYVISPPLPDDLSGIELVFKQFGKPVKNNAAGATIVFRLGL